MKISIEDSKRYENVIKKAKEHLGYSNQDLDDMTIESLVDIIEDLMDVIEHTVDELSNLQQDLEDNYKPIPKKDQYE